MIHIDLSKPGSLRSLIYLLGLFPGLFFLSSVAVGNALLAQTAVAHLKTVYPFPPYGLALILMGLALLIGQATILLSWMIDMLLRVLYRILRFLMSKLVQKVVAWKGFVNWFAKFQGNPPKHPLIARLVGKLMAFPIAKSIPDQQTLATWDCLVAATEKLLERRYGIDRLRASGANNGTWDVWCSVLGKPVRPFVESVNLGRIFLACGLAGFLAIAFAPRLKDWWFVILTSIFAFSGLWASFVTFFRTTNPVWRNAIRLQSVLLELQEWSNTEAK